MTYQPGAANPREPCRKDGASLKLVHGFIVPRRNATQRHADTHRLTMSMCQEASYMYRANVRRTGCKTRRTLVKVSSLWMGLVMRF